ncbi:SDR family NAD(P)-dependent oxidoreductase [Gracilibacillus phocaeensis]|uniref:SDR family NAD(P)-dependent oxidoreductase n=1 Tax=Gracilibacillus phocaeensis TaxID=2042304 RepID=UPI00102FB83F|nr:glucose 1-dehydrogenase [Gracilibacillus phocaeensis]
MKILDKYDLTNKVSIITGGATGLGKAMAEALAQAGSKIVIADIDVSKAEETAKQFSEAEGVESLAIQTDVTNEEQVQQMVDQVVERFGQIDVLINNAGIVMNEEAEETSLENWQKVMNINVNGVFITAKLVGKQMIKQQKGSIINISSMSGLVVNTPQYQASYNTSKAGVIMLTKSLAMEWAKHNIRVNTIAPGYMETELTKKFFEQGGITETWMGMTPMGRPGQPEELGGIALYLASEASSFATGSVFTIDGGYTAL